jgi:uncharacterized cupredoxin-like copper-binding protein
MRRTWLLLPILVLAGCGGGNNESTQAGPVVQTVQISEKEFSLTPSTVNVSKAGTVEFQLTNDGQVTHAFEVEGNGVEEETEDIEPGQSATLRVDLSKGGSYEMYCPIEPQGQGHEGHSHGRRRGRRGRIHHHRAHHHLPDDHLERSRVLTVPA